MERAKVIRRLENIHALCAGLAPKQAVGEAIAALLAEAKSAPVADERVGPMPWRLQIAAMMLSGLAESQERDERLVGWSLGTADALLRAAALKGGGE